MKKCTSFKIGAGIILFLAILVVISLFWTPYDPNKMNALDKFSAPSLKHWMGTDNFGRDLLSRAIEGLRTTLIVAVLTVGIGVLLGIVIGAFTGYFGGWLDEILMRVNDAVAAFPSVLLALIVISVLGPGKYNIIIALGIIFIPSFARIVRSEFINYKYRDYVKSASLLGAGDLRIMFIHILPNALDTIFSAVIVGFNNAVLAESSMSYLGLGVQPPDASLGRMISESQGYLTSAPWFCLFPSMILVLLVLGFVLIGTGFKIKKTQIKQEEIHAGELSIQELISINDPLLSVTDLKISFDQDEIVDHINFQVGKKEIVGIVGESGSGKTMTALSIAGLLPKDAQCTGNIIFNDIDLLNMRERTQRDYKGKKISIVFQEPMTSLNPVLKIGKQIEEMLKLHTNLSKKQRKIKVIAALGSVELPQPEAIYFKYPHELSGGMRQRVMIAMAMICNPELLIADEPTTALDEQIQMQILEILDKLNKEQGMSVLFISHDLNVIKKICNRVVVMCEGSIVEQGTVEDIFEHPQETYTKNLIASTNLGKKVLTKNKNKNILELKNLNIYYKEKNKKKYIINDLDLNIKQGEILGVVGPSGCGKTTLSKAIMGLHKDFEGQITHFSSMPQMIFQDPYSSLNPAKTIGWILAEPLRMKDKKSENYQKSYKEEVLKILKEVGLKEEIYHRYPKELSGGQRQRVSIAAALIAGAKFIIADEPVSALDVTIGKQVIELLLKLQKDYGLTILFISHDSKVIHRVSDRVLTLSS